MHVGFFRSFGFGRITQTAGTIIIRLVPGMKNLRTKVTKAVVTNSTTAHTLTFMRPLGKTTLSAAAAAAQTTIVLSVDPGNYSAAATAAGRPTPSVANNLLASGDYFAIRGPDGVWFHSLINGTPVTASDGKCTIVSTANVPTGGLPAGSTFYTFGVLTDTDPRTGIVHPLFTIPVSATTTFDGGNGSVAETIDQNEPIMIQENNATAAATLEQVSGVYGT